MSTYDLTSIESIHKAAIQAKADAGEHPDEIHYASWKHGYADALAEVSKQLASAPAGHFISEADLQRLNFLLEHTYNGVVECTLLGENSRITQFLREIKKLLEAFPTKKEKPSRNVVDYFRYEYQSAVYSLEAAKRKFEDAPEDKDTEAAYIREQDRELVLRDLCADLKITLRRKNNIIQPHDPYAYIEYTDLSMSMIHTIRAKYKELKNAIREARDNNAFIHAKNKKDFLAKICDEIILDLEDDNGDVIPPYDENIFG